MPGLISAPDPALIARFRAALDPLHADTDIRLGLAVSGGPDSLALLLLARATLPGRIEAATVDHALRAESADEAAMVAALCARFGVPHATLKSDWDSAGKEGPQAAARAYRYRELGDWCVRRHLPLLATAHHADDQAETVLMRLARGSGVAGLSAIRPIRRLHDTGPAEATDIHLIRPLLRFTKTELGAIVTAAGLTAVDDPSNASARYDRTRARRLLAETDWLDPARLAATASHMADAEAALRWSADIAFDRHITTDESENGNVWRLDPTGLPDEIVRRVIGRLIETVAAGHDGATPSGPDLARLIARLRRGETATLGPVLARPGAHWCFSVAPARRN